MRKLDPQKTSIQPDISPTAWHSAAEEPGRAPKPNVPPYIYPTSLLIPAVSSLPLSPSLRKFSRKVMEPPIVMLFEKVLSMSDVKSQLLLFKPCADALFPIVGETKIFRDPRGRTFELRHAFNGNPGRHRLSKDWRQFVRETRAAEGDTLILKKDAAGRFCIDLRRTSPELERHQDVVQPVARRRPRGVPPPPQV